ncbi:MAG: hypothetical protein AAF654_01820 [Myxococcota bacterium]
MSEQDPEKYSLALDLSIIAGIFTTVALVFGGTAYAALGLWNAASEKIAAVTEEVVPEEGFAEAVADQIQEKLQEFEEARTGPTARLELVDTTRTRTGFVVYGRLVNGSSSSVAPPRVEFLLLDSAGQTLSTETLEPKWLGLAPRESRPVELIVKAPKKVASIAVGKVTVEQIALPAPAAGLRVTLTQNVRRRNRRIFRGVVTNGGEDTAHHVEIDVVGYDKGTKTMMGVATARLRKPIPPGGELKFETSLTEFIGNPDEFSPIARALSAPVD